MTKYRVPTNSLKAVINPLNGEMWKVEPIAPEEVLAAVAQGDACEIAWGELRDELPPHLHRTFHITRIAWLVGNAPSDNDPDKVMLSVSRDRIWFHDGNHRVAAAIVRGDATVDLHIASSGELDLSELFPGIQKA